MGKVEDILTKFAGQVQIAALIEGTVVPIIIGTVKSIKVALQGQAVEYTVAITTGEVNLQQAANNFSEALRKINIERAKAGLAPLEIPGT